MRSFFAVALFAVAASGWAQTAPESTIQSALSKTVSLSSSMTLDEWISFLSESNVDIVASTIDFPADTRIRINVSNRTLLELIEAVAASLDARVDQVGRILVLKKNSVMSGAAPMHFGSAPSASFHEAPPPGAAVPAEGWAHTAPAERVHDTALMPTEASHKFHVAIVDTASRTHAKPAMGLPARMFVNSISQKQWAIARSNGKIRYRDLTENQRHFVYRYTRAKQPVKFTNGVRSISVDFSK